MLEAGRIRHTDEMFCAQLRDGLVLKMIEERHAEEVFAVIDRHRHYLSAWLPWAVECSPESTLTYIKNSLQQYANNEGFSAGIWWKNTFSGSIGFKPIDWLNRKVEIGYWLAEDCQGAGIMTACCRAVITHAFQEWKLNRVQLHCATGNTKSCAIAERLGFTLEGVERQGTHLNNRYQDLNLYSVLASEWRCAG